MKKEPHSDDLAVTELAPTQPATGEDTQPRVGAPTADKRVIGRFTIDAHLGAGGMGDVYRAYDPVLDRAVALKVLHTDPGADGDQRMRRVVREARAAAALTHPNTVTIFEVGEAGSEVFIAMELLEGEDLRAILDRGEASLDDKLRWLLQAARALGAAHDRGLVHRDVKPENMFVCKDGTLKLLDFGIAKRDDAEAAGHHAPQSMGPSSLRTEAGRRFGTPRYMAPEQRAGEATDPRTDEYAWGLVAFELLTGSDGIDALPTLTRDPADEAAPREPTTSRLTALHAKVPDLPEPIMLTIARALEPLKEDRFPSMAPIVAALEAKTESTPSSPRGSSTETGSAQPQSSPRTEPPITDRTPPPRSVPLWMVGGALGLAIAAVVGGVVGRRATTPTPPSAAEAPPPLPPACHVEATHGVPVEANDLAAVLPDQSVIVARDWKNGVRLERETPDGMVPILRNGYTQALGHNYESLEIRGLSYHGHPTIVGNVIQDPGGIVAAWTEQHGSGLFRIQGLASAMTTTTFGDDLVTIVTGFEMDGDAAVSRALVDAYLARPGDVRHLALEATDADHPSVATTDDRIAVAYRVPRAGIHMAVLDPELQRIGDVHKMAAADRPPAVAFHHMTVTVFWMQDHNGLSRLTVSTFTPGDAAPTAPKIAINDPMAPAGPVVERLPGARWAVAWVTSAGGPSTLRVSPIGPGGILEGPTDIATGPSITRVQTTATSTGIALAWRESDKSIRVAHVTCKPGAALDSSIAR